MLPKQSYEINRVLCTKCVLQFKGNLYETQLATYLATNSVSLSKQKRNLKRGRHF